jgi:hypothetical protein
MGNEAISRRVVVPALASGALAGFLAEPADAKGEQSKRFVATAGPAGLTRNQTMISSYFLPAVQAPGNRPPMKFRLALMSIQGILIGLLEESLSPGQGSAAMLEAFGDGSVRLNGKPVDMSIAEGTQVHVIAILIGLLLPAVQPAAATLQVSNHLRNENGGPAGLGPVSYILPYIEH